MAVCAISATVYGLDAVPAPLITTMPAPAESPLAHVVDLSGAWARFGVKLVTVMAVIWSAPVVLHTYLAKSKRVL